MTAFVSGRLAFVEDRYADAEEAFEASLALCTSSGAHVHCAFALRYIGRLAHLRGDYPKSIAAIEHALDLSRNLGLAGFVTVLTSDLGEAIAATGDFDRARAVLAGPLKSARDAGFLPGVAESLTALAQLEWRAGDKDAAASLAREAMDIALEANSADASARCDAMLGLVAADAGRVDEARTRHLGVLQRAALADAPRRTALALEGLANVALLEADACEAARLLGAASTLRASPGGAHGPAFVTTVLIDPRDLMAAAAEIARSEEVSRGFAQGMTDPSAVAESLLLAAGRGLASAQS
jgi:tetratricopeptide (TPR) repeat protein